MLYCLPNNSFLIFQESNISNLCVCGRRRHEHYAMKGPVVGGGNCLPGNNFLRFRPSGRPGLCACGRTHDEHYNSSNTP